MKTINTYFHYKLLIFWVNVRHKHFHQWPLSSWHRPCTDKHYDKTNSCHIYSVKKELVDLLDQLYGNCPTSIFPEHTRRWFADLWQMVLHRDPKYHLTLCHFQTGLEIVHLPAKIISSFKWRWIWIEECFTRFLIHFNATFCFPQPLKVRKIIPTLIWCV